MVTLDLSGISEGLTKQVDSYAKDFLIDNGYPTEPGALSALGLMLEIGTTQTARGLMVHLSIVEMKAKRMIEITVDHKIV